MIIIIIDLACLLRALEDSPCFFLHGFFHGGIRAFFYGVPHGVPHGVDAQEFAWLFG